LQKDEPDRLASASVTDQLNPTNSEVEKAWTAGLRRFGRKFPKLAQAAGLVHVAEQSYLRRANPVVDDKRFKKHAPAFAYLTLCETFVQLSEREAPES
jgi:hypothetical protein